MTFHNKNISGFGLRSLLRSTAFLLVMAFSCPALAVSPDVVISQVYGGGGNSGATYKNDFIELHNRGGSAVSLNGWSVQYASATGTTWAVTNLTNITLQPGQYYLVQEAVGAGGTTNLPTPDATGTIAMSATNGKVALVNGTTTLSGACPTGIKDLVGFGTANCSEASPVTALTNTSAALRAGNGCTDTDNNAADFSTGAPSPRNSASSVSVCAGTVINGTCGSSNGQALTTIPISNLCAPDSTASAISGNGPWTWTCAGSNGGSTASCSATLAVANGGPFTIFHVNDTHARLTPHMWLIPGHSDGSAEEFYEPVGGAAYVAGKMLALTAAQPNSLVIDAGDISEGNPIGDMNGNGSMTQFYQLLSQKLLAQRGRGMDAVVVGNHDVRDVNYITNLDTLASSGVPVLSVNVRDIATHSPHFAPYHIVTVNGTKVGILGYTTSASQVGASLASTLEVVDCDWSGTSAPCHLADYVNTLRNTEHADVVVLVAHIGHSALVDPVAPLLVDNAVAKVPEVVVTGHWHTWADTVWQPFMLNYKTIFTESSSYMKYIGELNVSNTGSYVSAIQHVTRNADITPDPDVETLVENLTAQYNTAHPGHPVDEVVGYTADDLQLDNDMRWWSPDEYPWSGNNSAGQWITDAMQWKCAQLFGQCDIAVEAGGGVRSDIPAGEVTYMQVYETFPWADDTFVRIDMTGQDIVNFLKETNLNAGFSSALDVTAVDGVPTSVTFNGQPIDLNHTYTVAINNYMLANPPSGYTWPTHSTPLSDSALVRDGIVEFMRTQHPDQAHAYQVGGDRYHLNGEYSGGYRAVVTMMNDNDTKPTYDAAFIRFLSATPETLARRGSAQVPADLVNADGSINAANRLSSQELFRSYLGFKPGTLHVGDIIETWGKASFYGGNPEFVDQEGIQSDGVELKIVGHDDSLAKPEYVASIGALLNDRYKNHYVKFLARKTASDTVADQNSQTVKIWDVTGYAAAALPGNVNDILEISGVLTMENYGFRFRRDQATVSTSALPAATSVSSQVDPLASVASAPITLSATAGISGGGYNLMPIADAQVESGSPTYNGGNGNNLFIQSSNTGTYGNERAWLKFDISGIPAGSTITGATLQLWDWKATGASLPVDVLSSTDDTWTETGINWTNQPALGAVLDTQTLAAGTTNVWYNWDVTSFVQGQWNGDKTVSLLVKPVSEGSTDTTAPSYGFDAKEYGSNAPLLHVTTQATASSVANVKFFYRYSSNNLTWGAWTQTGSTDTAAPYNTGFSFPNGYGYYEFYSVATDNLGGVEPTPAYAQSAVHYQAASGSVQNISFPQPADMQVNSTVSLPSATASSGLAVTLSSQTTGVCTVSDTQVTAIAGGTCTIAADQSGDQGYWLPAQATRSFTVLKIGQTISFGALADHALGSGTVTLTAAASSNLGVTYTSTTPSVCTVSGTTVTLFSAGTCSIAADQTGDGSYAAAPTVTQSFNVTPANGGGAEPVPALGLWGLMLAAAGLGGIMALRRNPLT